MKKKRGRRITASWKEKEKDMEREGGERKTDREQSGKGESGTEQSKYREEEREGGNTPLHVLPPPKQVMVFPVKLHKVHPEAVTARRLLFSHFMCIVLGATVRTLDSHNAFPTLSVRTVKPHLCHLYIAKH